MILVNIASFVVYVWVLAAMTNWLVGIAGALVLLGAGYTMGLTNGFLAAFVFGAVVWGNLPFEDPHHDDGHGHAPAQPSHALSFWHPWGIAYRLVATIAACSFVTLLASQFSDPTVTIFGMTRETSIANAVFGVRTGAIVMALMVIFQVVTNYSIALPQGPMAAPAPAGHAAHAGHAAPAAAGTPEGASGDRPAGPPSGGGH